MKLVARVKLLPDVRQADLLRQTLERANAACNAISQQAWDTHTFRQYDLHLLVYETTRVRFGLAAQVVVRCIAKVADAYKRDRRTQRAFKPRHSIAYDDRILSWRETSQTVSIWTIVGRIEVPFVCGAYQQRLLEDRRGESDLIYRDGVFYLFATCEVGEPPLMPVESVLGVDVGIVNIATDSDGNVYSGSQTNNVRHRHRRLRRKLQSKGTHGARRRLKRLAGKERRFASHVNHCISKQLVHTAQGTHRAIALEDLTGIRERVTVTRGQRAGLHSWAFFQLRQFVEYKARLAGVPVVLVDPRDTSRTCPMCGCVDKHNRSSQSRFQCVVCGFAAHADTVAAVNIGRRGAVNQPCYPDAPGPSAAQRQGKIPQLAAG